MMGGMMTSAKGRLVLTTGSRTFTRRDLVTQEIGSLATPSFVLHGGARGADALVSDAIHETAGLVELRMPYLRLEGKRGGFLRNREMLTVLKVFRDQGYDCWALAFHTDIKTPTRGTSGMIQLLLDADVTVVHIDGASGQGW